MKILNMIIKTHFDAAHYLENYKGKCSNLHGHRWEVEAYIHIDIDDDCDMIIDFRDAKKIILKYLPDHQYLNELYDFNPTAENIVRHLKTEIQKELPLVKLILWESPNSGVII